MSTADPKRVGRVDVEDFDEDDKLVGKGKKPATAASPVWNLSAICINILMLSIGGAGGYFASESSRLKSNGLDAHQSNHAASSASRISLTRAPVSSPTDRPTCACEAQLQEKDAQLATWKKRVEESYISVAQAKKCESARSQLESQVEALQKQLNTTQEVAKPSSPIVAQPDIPRSVNFTQAAQAVAPIDVSNFESGKELFVRLNLAHLDEKGRLAGVVAPAFTDPRTKLFVEVGANSFRLLSDKDILLKKANAYLVQFEPVLSAFAGLISRKTKWEEYRPLAEGPARTRGIVLPIALSTKTGFATFSVSQQDGCSSLVKMKKSVQVSRCSTIMDRRTVPTVTMETVIKDWFGGRTIDFLKIDAQGVDHTILDSAGSEMSKIKAVSIEVIGAMKEAAYEGQPKCDEVIRKFEGRGYYPVRFTVEDCKTLFERDVLFEKRLPSEPSRIDAEFYATINPDILLK